MNVFIEDIMGMCFIMELLFPDDHIVIHLSNEAIAPGVQQHCFDRCLPIFITLMIGKSGPLGAKYTISITSCVNI
jgi:hypothetical protein